MQIGVQVDIEAAIKKLDVFRRDQLPFALAKALTNTAQDVKDAEVEEMRKVFKSPTDWTLNSLYVKPATKAKLEAKVWIKNFAAKGPSPEDWLKPEVMGGPRKFKRMEKALQSRGLLPAGMMMYPTKYADLDAHGNIKAGQVVQILSSLQAFGEQGYRANMSSERKTKFEAKKGYMYFVGKPKGKIAGIWKRVNFASGSAVVPIFYFIPSPTYKPRLDFYGVANRVYGARFFDNFRNAMAKAVETAR